MVVLALLPWLTGYLFARIVSKEAQATARSSAIPSQTDAQCDGPTFWHARESALRRAIRQERGAHAADDSALHSARARASVLTVELSGADDAPGFHRLEFPPQVEPGFAPEDFQRVVERVLAECGLGLQLDDLDCSEFPCIAWTNAVDPTLKRHSLLGCTPWEESFDTRTGMALAQERSDGGVRRIIGLYALPKDAALRMAALQRAQVRARQRLGGTL